MSTVTPPASSQSPVAPSPVNPPQESTQNVSPAEQAILEYLRSRGYSAAEKALLNDLDATSPDGKGKQPDTIGVDEFVKTLAVFAQKPSRPGENIFKDSSSVLQELTAMGNPTNIQNLIASIGSIGAEEILSLDPTDKEEGFRELEAWVDGSLDMYRVCSLNIQDKLLIIFLTARISTDLIPYFLSLLPTFNTAWVQGCWYVTFIAIIRIKLSETT